MNRPVHFRWFALLAFGGVATTGAILGAEAESGAPPVRERATSSRVAGLLATASAKYLSPSASTAVAATASAAASRETGERAAVTLSERVASANGIVRLPEYVVRERKPSPLPQPEEVMSRASLERMAMQRFLGDEQGLERALSMITPVHLWRKIPVLGRFPFVGFETNEQRAMRLYDAQRMKERWEELGSLLSPQLRPSVPPLAPPPPQE